MNLVAGLSSSLQDQLKQILEVVGTALKKVNRSLQESAKQKVTAERQAQTCREYEARVREAIRQGTWHDPRLDAIAGVGVISELGVGDEAFDELVVTSTDSMDAEGLEKRRASEDELSRKERTAEELYAIGSLPVVIIKNYAARGRTSRQEMQEVLGQWAATLVENQVFSSLQLRTTADTAYRLPKLSSSAITVRMQNYLQEVKILSLSSGLSLSPLWPALPSKPLNFVALSDADVQSSLSFVKKRLRDTYITSELTSKQIDCIERLGGRASDLESVSKSRARLACT